MASIWADLKRENSRSYSDQYFHSQCMDEIKDELFWRSATGEKNKHSNILFGFVLMAVRDLESEEEVASLNIEEEEGVISRKLERKTFTNKEKMKRFAVIANV